MSKLSKKMDIYIGERIRERRIMMGLTQEHLAQALEISYQQVQKYETAANRVSAGRLYEIAAVLGVGPVVFFHGFDESATTTAMEHGGKNRTVIELVTNYQSIKDPGMRLAVSSLAKSLAGRNRERGSKLKNAA